MDTEHRESPSVVASDSCGPPAFPISAQDSDDENPNLEASSEEQATLSPDLEWLEELEVDEDSDLADAADQGKELSYAETSRMFKLRRNLDQLDHFYRQKEHDVLKARENLNLCHQNIEHLIERRENLEREIEQQKAAEKSVVVFRLRAQHRNLCQTLLMEEELEGHILAELKQEELELSKLEVEIGTFSSLRQELEEEEQVFQVLKDQKAATRLRQEKKTRQILQLKKQHLRDEQAASRKAQEEEHQKKIVDGLANRKIAAKYLKESIKRMQQQQTEKEQSKRELLEKRIQAVNALKSNIEATQESLRVRQSKTKASEKKKKQLQNEMKESLQAQGLNSIKHIYQQKQLEKLKQQQAEFEEKQKSNRVAIVAKILQEETLVRRRKRNQVVLPKPQITETFPSLEWAAEKLWYSMNPSPPSEERTKMQLRKFSDSSKSSSSSSDMEDMEETIFHKAVHQSLPDNLAEPEFSGLWEQNSKMLLNEKKTLIQKDVNNQEERAQKEKLHKPAKKVHGQELMGASFISKPDVILFKDFDVGKTYKKKITLTNISQMTNYCKLHGVSAQLKEFLSINFKPPGSLASGMSCDVQAVFQPMINEDLEGEVQFASALGPFSVPVRCTIKTCELQVDSEFIDFGSHVVGQTISRTITLTNNGALATLFSLDTSTCLRTEASHVQMPSKIFSNMCQETSSENTTSESQTSSASVNAGELQPDQENNKLTEVQKQTEASTADPEDLTEGCILTNADELDESSADFCDISLGNVREGEIGPFQSIKLDVCFCPTIPGEAKLEFLIKFSDTSSKPILIKVRGVAVNIPVWVVEPNIDLKICMFDFLYQDAVILQSSASTALRLTFEVCPEMRKHMEVLPRTGFIQAGSTFKAQLKFSPRHTLSKDGKKYFDSYTGVLECPLTVHVAGQVEPLHFTVHAVVTSSDLHFDQTHVDFGYCSIYQSVKSTVHLSNLSLLPQDFGFLGVPEFVEIQPNNGFGTLLPKETLEIDLIFSAHKAKNYSFQLSCKSGINRDFTLSCQAMGVQPPLKLSHSLVHFGGTAIGDNSTALLYLINQDSHCNQPKHSASPVGKDASTPTSRLFSFTPPESSDISITPAAGRLLPGELPTGRNLVNTLLLKTEGVGLLVLNRRHPRTRCLVQVMFTPRLSEQAIKDEALRLHHQAQLLCEKELERKRRSEQEAEKGFLPKSSKKKEASVNLKPAQLSVDPKTNKPSDSPNSADMQPGSKLYEQARTSLLYSFNKRYSEYLIPCFISDPPEDDRQAQTSWSTFNTLYLSLQCLAVQPPLVVVSNNGHRVIDFHQVTMGDKVVKKCTIQNISQEPLDLSSSMLDINGPFILLNALRCIKPGDKHTLVLAFSPTQDKKFCEALELRTQRMTLDMTLCGEGVVPAVTVSHPSGLLDFGYVLKNESISHVLNLQNNSVVSVAFKVLLASVSSPTPQDEADMVALLLGGYKDSKLKPSVGTQNYSGLCVFSVAPPEGSIAPGQSQDITVTFQPDHPSVNYLDKLTVELNNKTKVLVVDLKGAATSNNMYLYGGDRLTVPIESLLPPLIMNQPLTETEAPEKPITLVLVTLQASYRDGSVRPAVRELYVGCIRSTQASKKSVEFHWDTGVPIQQQGFNIEPNKGIMEAGEKCTIRITWTPQSGYKPYEVVETCVALTLKGEDVNVYRVALMASVSIDD